MACDNLANNLGGQYGSNGQFPQEELGEDGVRMGYDRTKLQARNIKRMVQKMDRTGYLGQYFIYAEHISQYASGEKLDINEGAYVEKLVNLHKDGRSLAALFTKSLFLKRFARTDQSEADKWLKGVLPRRWTLGAVVPTMRQ